MKKRKGDRRARRPGKGVGKRHAASPPHTPRPPAVHAGEVIEQSERIRRVLGELLQISLADLPFDEQLYRILNHLVSIPWLALESKGAIFLVEQDASVLVMKAQYNLALPLCRDCERVPFGRCLCGRAAASGKVQFADRVDARHDVRYDGMKPHGHYCVPVSSRGKLVGVINLYVKEGTPRNRRHVQFLCAVADILAGIIEHRRVEEELKSTLAKLRTALGATVRALAHLVESRDPYTAGHQWRVADLARAIATEMGLSREQIDTIRLAGLIHDIGKISIPAEILSKPARLTPIEFELVKTHARIGYDILARIDFPGPVAQIVLQHHEKINGTGYPQGLVGDQILIEARILCVADVVESMASHRPYRASLGIDKALEEIAGNKGILYDAAVADACIRLFTENRFAWKVLPQ